MTPWLKNVLTIAGVLAALLAPVYFFMERHDARHTGIAEYVFAMETRHDKLIKEFIELKCAMIPDACDSSLDKSTDGK